MTYKETFNVFRHLIKDLFCGGDHRSKEEMAKIRVFLWTRAWLIYSIILIDKAIKVFSGNAYWQKAYNEKETAKLEDLNLSFVEQTESLVIGADICMLVLGIMLSTLTWKYRHLAQYIIYHGLVVLLIQAFVPQKVETLTTEICLQTIILYFCNSSGAGTEIIASSIVCFVLLMT